MSRTTALLGTSLLVLLASTACQDAVTSPSAVAPSPARRATAATGTIAGPRAGIARAADLRAFDPRKAVDPTECSDNSLVNSWINDKLFESLTVEPDRFLSVYFDYFASDVVFYQAVFFESEGKGQFFGVNGVHTQRIVKTERDLKKFWTIPSADMQVVGMHGATLADTLKSANVYRFFGNDDATSRGAARDLRLLVNTSKTMVNGNHPYFTFNAVSIPAFPGVPNTIVMGDGIMQVYDEIGFGDVAPQAILAHEFGHQVQFAGNYGIATTDDATATRFAELGADFFAAYFLTHSRGASMNRKRVEQFLQVFYQIGDCAFDFPDHHGTPTQRMAAARAGFNLADQAQKQGHILSPDAAQAAYLAAYPSLIAQ